MREYSYILEQQGKTTAEKLAEFTAALGWRDELATYQMEMENYEMQVAQQQAEIQQAQELQEAAAALGLDISSTVESALESIATTAPPYTAEELAKLDAESAAYYDAFAANYVATAAFTGSGSGTAEDPYIITNKAELEAITNDLSAHYLLGNNIDIGTTWTSIGTASAPFLGSFDGDGRNITYTGDHTYLFENTNGATISRTALYGISVSVLFSGGEIGECAVFSVTSTSAVCGIVAETRNSATIHDCYVNGVSNPGFNGDNRASGIVGITMGDTTIQNSYVVNFELSSYTNAPSNYGCSSGGIVGTTGWGVSPRVTVSGCVALDGDLIGTGNRIGRIAGNTLYGTKVFTNNYAGSDITLNGNTVSGGTTSDKNGADVSPSTYYTQAFWQNTLGWDFDTVWYWDDTANLPKLRAFLHGPTISSVSATPTTGGVDTEITLSATVQDATSYQWQYSTNSGGTWQDITGATSATSTWTPGAVGTYQVQLLATNSDGTTTSDPVTVTIYPSPTISDVTIYPNPSEESATFLISATVDES